jgi:ribosomal protein S27AE/ABC-type multidrug transport system fused ATPase/permease subunit
MKPIVSVSFYKKVMNRKSQLVVIISLIFLIFVNDLCYADKESRKAKRQEKKELKNKENGAALEEEVIDKNYNEEKFTEEYQKSHDEMLRQIEQERQLEQQNSEGKKGQKKEKQEINVIEKQSVKSGKETVSEIKKEHQNEDLTGGEIVIVLVVLAIVVILFVLIVRFIIRRLRYGKSHSFFKSLGYLLLTGLIIAALVGLFAVLGPLALIVIGVIILIGFSIYKHRRCPKCNAGSAMEVINRRLVSTKNGLVKEFGKPEKVPGIISYYEVCLKCKKCGHTEYKTKTEEKAF